MTFSSPALFCYTDAEGGGRYGRLESWIDSPVTKVRAMAASEKKNRLAVITIVTALILSFAGLYFLSTDTYRQRSEIDGGPERPAAAGNDAQGAAKEKERLVLKRGERVDVGRTSLIYEGIEDGEILVDLYLLDLDSKQGYLKKIEEDKAEEELRLGPVTYRLITANRTYLVLQIVSMTRTP